MCTREHFLRYNQWRPLLTDCRLMFLFGASNDVAFPGQSRMRSKYLKIIVILATAAASCHKRPVVALPPPPPTTVTTVVVPVATPAAVTMDIPSSLPIPAGDNLFEQAELAFEMGDYIGAIQGYEDYLQFIPAGNRIDQALFHLGVAYVLQTEPPPNWKQATVNFKRLIDEHPDSPLR